MSCNSNYKCCITQDIYEVVTPNTNLSVTLDEAYIACRMDFLVANPIAAQTTWFTMAIKTAIKSFEDISRRTLMTTGFRTFRDCWNLCFELRKSPLQTITSVKYFDVDAVEQTVDSADYYIQKDPFYSLARFDAEYEFPDLRENRPQQIIIDFTSGYADDELEVTDDIKQAILQHVCYMNANRGDCSFESGESSAKLSGAYPTYRSYKIEEI